MKIIAKYLNFIILPFLLLAGCTNEMIQMNTDSKALTDANLAVDGVLYKLHIQNMEKNLFNINTTWAYQVQENLNSDIFAGYTMHAGTFGLTATNDNYDWQVGWDSEPVDLLESNFTDFLALKAETQGKNIGDFYGLGLILKVWTAIPVVDDFGPFPYLQYGVTGVPVFNSIDSIYKFGFIGDLNKAIDSLKLYENGSLAGRVQASGADLSSLGGNLSYWLKLANTLKLRVAIRMSTVDPTDASTYIAQCLNDSIGFIDNSVGDVYINTTLTPGLYQPFFWISTQWTDCEMSSDMQSFMDGYQDPRESVFFLPPTDSLALAEGAKFAGIRAGATLPSGKLHYGNFSYVNPVPNFLLLASAENYFLLAEAALRSLGGLNPSVAKGYYEAGVTQSFTANGLSSEASGYLQSTNTQANYVDYAFPVNNYSANSKATPQWDATGVTNYEQIITQKWIANFPRGAESWAEFRRTGFPKLVIPYNISQGSNFDGTIAQNHFLTRMPYSCAADLISISPVQCQSAIQQYLGNQDNGSVLLWWEPQQMTYPNAK